MPGLLTVVAGVVCGPVAVTWYCKRIRPEEPAVRRVGEGAGRGVEVADRAVSRLAEQRVGQRARGSCSGYPLCPLSCTWPGGVLGNVTVVALANGRKLIVGLAGPPYAPTVTTNV